VAEAGRMKGKTVVVTGATTGIGKETAREIARMGARVVLAARNADKAKATIAEIADDTYNDQLEHLPCDFESQKSIREAAAEYRRRHPRLDVLVNNAGAVFTERALTVDGLERTFALNHLGYFLFTTLLLDLLEASAPARIVNVASAAHLGARIDLDDLQSEKALSGLPIYGMTKLCNVLFTKELARRVDPKNVTVNCLHPGVISSGFGRDTGGLLRLGISIGKLFFTSPQKGARTSIKLATSRDVESVTGEYFDAKGRVARVSPIALDEDLARRLWEKSEELVRRSEP